MGIQFGLGDADLLGLGRGVAFGAADVGPALQQFRRNAHHRFARRRGNRPLSQAGLQVGGRNAQQGAKPVLALPQRDFEPRDRGLGLREHAVLLVDVQFTALSGFHAGLGDLQDFTLQFHVLPGQFDPFLGLANQDVVRGHVAQQGDQHGVVVFHRAVQLGLGGQHLTAIKAPEVQFPGQIEPEIPIVEGAGECRGGG